MRTATLLAALLGLLACGACAVHADSAEVNPADSGVGQLHLPSLGLQRAFKAGVKSLPARATEEADSPSLSLLELSRPPLRWPHHSKRTNAGESVRVRSEGRPRIYSHRDYSRVSEAKRFPKHSAAESYVEMFKKWPAKPKPSSKSAAAIKRAHFLGKPKAKPKPQPKPKPVKKPAPPAPKLAPLPPSSMSAVPVVKSKVATPEAAPAVEETFWTPWRICMTVVAALLLLALFAGLWAWYRNSKKKAAAEGAAGGDRPRHELYAAV